MGQLQGGGDRFDHGRQHGVAAERGLQTLPKGAEHPVVVVARAVEEAVDHRLHALAQLVADGDHHDTATRAGPNPGSPEISAASVPTIIQ